MAPLSRDLAEISAGSLTPDEVEYHTQALTRHYGERVAAVSRYCDAFRAWAGAIEQKIARMERGDEDRAYAEDAPERIAAEVANWRRVLDALTTLQIPILKSNLLARLIYAGQPIRTEMCPVHKGQWNGYGDVAGGRDHMCECQEGGYDITGWLPAHDRPLFEKIALFCKEKGWPPATCATHFPASPDYDPNKPVVAKAGGYKVRAATLDQAAELLAEHLSSKGFSAASGQPGGGS